MFPCHQDVSQLLPCSHHRLPIDGTCHRSPIARHVVRMQTGKLGKRERKITSFSKSTFIFISFDNFALSYLCTYAKLLKTGCPFSGPGP